MITISALTKRYGGFTALDDISFSAQPGRVTGFLGPNGAGKSTTLRILTGLAEATSGTARVLGRRFTDLPNPGREVGVLLDASAQHDGRTGRESLVLVQRTLGLPVARVNEALERVGLTPQEARRRVRNYSLGMRQRLGVATALIGDPEVLILDEPANGLDPAGIRWMRDLLRGFADDGGTVLLSSHLLAEIETIADDIVVIGGGRIVAGGPKSELLAGADGTLVRADDVVALTAALEAAGQAAAPTDDGAVLTDADLATAGRAAFSAGVPVTELRVADGVGLEETFLALTAPTQRDTGSEARPSRPNVPPHAPTATTGAVA